MTATRRVFNETADALKEAHEAFNDDSRAVHEALDRVTREIANVFKRDNSNFDRERFMRATGYGTGVRSCHACVAEICDSCIDGNRISAVPYSCDCARAGHVRNAVCTICHTVVYPDSSYASGYRHAQPSLHGAAVANA